MNLPEIVLLGLVQGFTEFLPVSSSGHLVILQNLLQVDQPGITLDIFLHTGTLLSVVVIFRKDIIELVRGFLGSFNKKYVDKTGYRKLAWLIIAANVPAAFAGILLKDSIEGLFSSSRSVSMLLIVTGIILFSGKFFRTEKKDMKGLGLINAVIIGIGQMLAILPGISRSGTTITAGIMLGVRREDAARFSFLLMLPAVAGATLLEIIDMTAVSAGIIEILTGMTVAFVSGYFAIKFVFKLVSSLKFHYFGYYCITAGMILFFLL